MPRHFFTPRNKLRTEKSGDGEIPELDGAVPYCLVEQFLGRAVRESVLDSMDLDAFSFYQRIECPACGDSRSSS